MLQSTLILLSRIIWIFRLALEKCKVCKGTDCNGESIEIINNACSDGTQFATFISIPVSASSTTNQYINTINSEYSYQLAELTLFQFPDTPGSKSYIIVNLVKILPCRNIPWTFQFSNSCLRHKSISKTACWWIQTQDCFSIAKAAINECNFGRWIESESIKKYIWSQSSYL